MLGMVLLNYPSDLDGRRAAQQPGRTPEAAVTCSRSTRGESSRVARGTLIDEQTPTASGAGWM